MHMLRGPHLLDTAGSRDDPSVAPVRSDECAQLSAGARAAVLADIYCDEINLAVWQRTLRPAIESAARDLARRIQPARASLAVSPSTVRSSVSKALGVDPRDPLGDDIVELVEMFSELFGCSRAGLRLTETPSAVCYRSCCFDSWPAC